MEFLFTNAYKGHTEAQFVAFKIENQQRVSHSSVFICITIKAVYLTKMCGSETRLNP